MRRTLLQNQFFCHTGYVGKALGETVYLMEGQCNTWWPNFRRQKMWQMPTNAMRNAMRNPPENQQVISHKKLAFQENPLSSFLTKFRFCRGKLIKIEQSEKNSLKISFKGLKMTLACWIRMIWTMSTTVAFVRHPLHLLSPKIWPSNVELTFYQVHCSCQNLSCIVAVSEELIFWQSVTQQFLSAAA